MYHEQIISLNQDHPSEDEVEQPGGDQPRTEKIWGPLTTVGIQPARFVAARFSTPKGSLQRLNGGKLSDYASQVPEATYPIYTKPTQRERSVL